MIPSMQVHYINLKRRTDRNDQFLAMNAEIIDCQWKEAVDGSKIQYVDLIRDRVVVEPLEHFTPGAIGNALSHKQLWEQCSAGSSPITVAEDDAVFNRNFVAKSAQVLEKLPTDWDMILWGWNFDSILHLEIMAGLKQTVLHFDSRAFGPRMDDFRNADYEVSPYRMFGAFGHVCYSVTPNGAKRLLECGFPITNDPIFVPGLERYLYNISIDATLNKYYREMNAYVCFPPLVWTENDKGQSDIQSNS